MSDCCTPGPGFPNAASMEQLATNLPVVWEEICSIQQAILAASSQCQPGGGQMCTTVGGNTPMTFVTGVNSVTVVNGGSGYFTDTPSVRFVPPLGALASGATATLLTNGTNIIAVNMATAGSGYQPVLATLAVSSVLGISANLQPLVDASGAIVGINIISGGSGYTTGDSIVATRAVSPNSAYVDATFDITSVSITGQILSVAILISGSGYQPSVATVEIVSTLNPLVLYPLGTGFFGDVLTDNSGGITGVSVVNTGSGYATYSPFLVISDPGTGATTSVALSGTSVSSISVITGGSNYTSSATGIVFNPSTAPLPNPPITAATVTIQTSVNTFGTNPTLYWQVWSAVATNRPIQLQMASVISYFQNLGYTITRQTNPNTTNTIQWKICW